jgi:hypothetical protein
MFVQLHLLYFILITLYHNRRIYVRYIIIFLHEDPHISMAYKCHFVLFNNVNVIY